MNRLGDFMRNVGGCLAVALCFSASNAAADDVSHAVPPNSPSSSVADSRLMTRTVQTESSASADVDSQLTTARAAVEQAAKELDEFLNRGSPANANAWKTFLGWEILQAQLLPKAQPDAEALGKPLAQLVSGEAGLEMPPFVALREALTGYRRRVLFNSDDQMRTRYERELQTIVSDLSDGPIDTRNLGRLSTQLEFLEQLDHAPRVVSETRQKFGQPNLYASASGAMIQRLLSEPVSRSSSISETILGTRIRGTAHLNGNLTAQLVPCPDAAKICLLLTGQSVADTVGRQSPVTVFSRGFTDVTAQSSLRIEPTGVSAEPACAHCTTSSQICSIRADNRLGKHLIEKIAWKKARQQQRQAERISSRLAESRVTRNVNRDASQRVASSNRRWEERLRTPLRRRRLYPRFVKLWSTAKRLNLVATEGHQRQLAATSPPPEAPSHDVVLQVHESMLLNVAVNAIGGLKLTDENAVELIKKATGEVPVEMEIKQDEDPWSITFDFAQPVRISFDDNRVKIVIRGRRFIRGNQVVRQATDIAATYDFVIEDGRAKLRRVGDVEVTYPGKEESSRLSLTELRNKTFLTNKFGGLFKPELEGSGIKLPDDFRGLDRIQDLQLEHLSAEEGWLSLGWK